MVLMGLMMNRMSFMALLVLVGALLSACGGGGGGGSADGGAGGDTTQDTTQVNPPVTLSGTALVGAPLQQGSITAKDSAGIVQTDNVDEDTGEWSVTLQSPTYPILIVARGSFGGQSHALYSVVAEPSTGAELQVNVNPVTSVVVQRALFEAGVTVDSTLSAWAGVDNTEQFKQRVNHWHQTVVQYATPLLNAAGVDANQADFFASRIAPNGQALDGVLDRLRLSFGTQGQLLVAGLADEPADLVATPTLTAAAPAGLPANVFETLALLSDNLANLTQGAATAQIEAALHPAFIDEGRRLTPFMNDSPRWSVLSNSGTDVWIERCEAAVRANDDQGINGRVCTARVGGAADQPFWTTKLLFDQDATGADRARLIGNRYFSEHVMGVSKLEINTVDAQPIVDRENYIRASFRLTGGDGVEDFFVPEGTTHGIRGRGNSTWSYPKKPYRIKFSQNVPRDDNEGRSIAGRVASRDWVLLAQFREESLLVTPAALQAARLLDIPYVNSAIPVEVTLNGQYLGVYVLTEAIEAKPGRVEIDTSVRADQGGSYIIELSKEFDQPGEQFRSRIFEENGTTNKLPVMVKDAKSSTNPDVLAAMEQQFYTLELAVQAFRDTGEQDSLRNVLDVDAAGKFLAHNYLVNDPDLNNPKSVYMIWNANLGKYQFGPVWDFDWGRQTVDNFHTPFLPFFRGIFDHPDVKAAFCSSLRLFGSRIGEFDAFVDDYSAMIATAYTRDRPLWPNTFDRNNTPTSPILSQVRLETIDPYVGTIKSYYRARAQFLITQHSCP